jgi:hypothetical protein
MAFRVDQEGDEGSSEIQVCDLLTPWMMSTASALPGLLSLNGTSAYSLVSEPQCGMEAGMV